MIEPRIFNCSSLEIAIEHYAIATANDIANAYVNANANIIAIAKAVNTNTNAIAIAKAYVIANAIAIAYAEAIYYTRELEECKIFNNVNFTMLIDELNKLKTQIPDQEQPQEVHQTFVKRLQQTLLNAFNLSPDTINLSLEENKALENYLYANHLLIQCKQASVRVSPQTWEGIETRMLLVPSD